MFQVGTIWSAGVPTRFTAPVNGVYALIVNLEWRPNATGQRAVLVERSTGVTDEFQSQGSGGSKSNQSIYAEFSLTSGQYLVVRALQVSGAALTLHGGNKDRTRASCWLIGQVV